MTSTILHGDCIAVMRTMPEASVDAIVTDPPYGLGFMGKEWDDLPPGLDFAVEAFRVLKPGGHILAFGGTRTWHRLAVAIEDAGFEIRDSIAWLYGSGFPKSMDVSKAIDKAAGATREVVGVYTMPSDSTAPGFAASNGGGYGEGFIGDRSITAPATDAARQWQGWGTALKPAFEPIVVGRKPLIGTVAANVLAHGTGALNIDGARIPSTDKAAFPAGVVSETEQVFGNGAGMYASRPRPADGNPEGRFPANVILDESQAAALDEQSGYMKDGTTVNRNKTVGADSGNRVYGQRNNGTDQDVTFGGGGGASRFFYCAKAPKSERPVVDGVAHPTVKPLALMRYLIRLVTPPGGVVLDPFAGSGTTVEAAILEGFRVVGVEREAEYLPLIRARITRAEEAMQPKEPEPDHTLDFGDWH